MTALTDLAAEMRSEARVCSSGFTSRKARQEKIAEVAATLNEWATRLDALAQGWISVEDRLPDAEGCYLAVVAPPNGKPYVSLVCWGKYEYFTEDDPPRMAVGEVLDTDESMVSGKGWHNEEDSHGGEYDTYVVTFHDKASRGRVTHWQKRPDAPPLTPTGAKS